MTLLIKKASSIYHLILKVWAFEIRDVSKRTIACFKDHLKILHICFFHKKGLNLFKLLLLELSFLIYYLKMKKQDLKCF